MVGPISTEGSFFIATSSDVGLADFYSVFPSISSGIEPFGLSVRPQQLGRGESIHYSEISHWICM